MKYNKLIDKFIIVILILQVLMLVGLIFDVWYLAYYPIPLFAGTLIVICLLNNQIKWKGAIPATLSFSVILIALFIWAGIKMNTNEMGFGGLTHSMSVLFYVIWPFLTFFAPLFYAFIYEKALREVKQSPKTSLQDSQDEGGVPPSI